jgi:hypothetical protein
MTRLATRVSLAALAAIAETGTVRLENLDLTASERWTAGRVLRELENQHWLVAVDGDEEVWRTGPLADTYLAGNSRGDADHPPIQPDVNKVLENLREYAEEYAELHEGRAERMDDPEHELVATAKAEAYETFGQLIERGVELSN